MTEVSVPAPIFLPMEMANNPGSMTATAAAMAAAARGMAPSAGGYAMLPPASSNFQYLVQDYVVDAKAEDMQEELNALGAEGWQLLFVNQSKDNVRAWFIKQGPPLKVEETSGKEKGEDKG